MPENDGRRAHGCWFDKGNGEAFDVSEMSKCPNPNCGKSLYYLSRSEIKIRNGVGKSEDGFALQCPHCDTLIYGESYDSGDRLMFELEEIMKEIKQLKDDVSDLPTADVSSQLEMIEKLLLALVKKKKK